jgi:hypothetical protein
MRVRHRKSTFRPIDIDGMLEADRCALFAKLRNKLAGYARKHGVEATYAWSREVGVDGLGEHMHVLIHIPPRLHRHFASIVWTWLPERSDDGVYMSAVDVRLASQRTMFTDADKRLNAIGYICKEMTPQAAYRRQMNRRRGGAILGKRGGVTANIDRKAIEAWKANEMRGVPDS